MSFLYQALENAVADWRAQQYQCEKWPAIAEILQYAEQEDGSLRYLRKAQFNALEAYWYLRVKLGTPTIPELYQKLFPKVTERLTAMGVDAKLYAEADYDFDELVNKLLNQPAFVKQHKLESLRETYLLNYPSYILALAMGAGKTILMGAIAATEFVMAQEYPTGPFVENALIFAPGKTIIESLRELADVPFGRILPPRLNQRFAASLKLTFTRDGEKELPVTWGSSWNIIVTNSEKIRIQKSGRRKTPQLSLALVAEQEDHDAEIANLRLRAIASLPALAVFSDEAHHTYGQKLLGKWKTSKESGELEFIEEGLKKIRKTVNFLADETDLKLVVNTTGTPYFERQPLRDVVCWYSLGQGIEDGILKSLHNNIHVFDLDESDGETLVQRMVADFVADYWQVSLPDGSPARMALYFPNTAGLDDLKPAIESALAQQGHSPACVLAVHSKSEEQTRREFYRVANDPSSPYRIILLVNMGTEGWNCPSLFACGLVRKLKTSNNFVLQAATRCLRQVPGNETPARVYVSKSNKALLEKQLLETYGTSINELSREESERVEQQIELRQPNLPPLKITRRIARYVRSEKNSSASALSLAQPTGIAEQAMPTVSQWNLVQTHSGKVTMQRVDGGEDRLEFSSNDYSLYGAAAELAANYHLPMAAVLKALRQTYSSDQTVPEQHLPQLGQQIEDQTSHYEQQWEEIDVALALIKPEGFDRQPMMGGYNYTARISFAKHRANLYKTADDFADPTQAREHSFHYEGYNFDSNPEAHYLERVLAMLNAQPERIANVWFTGGITDPAKTELFAEYIGEDGRWHRYTPDFVIARNDGKHLVVEIKSDNYKAAINEDLDRHQRNEPPITPEGRKAVALKRWEALNPDVLSYEVIFADSSIAENALDRTREFLAGG